MALTVVVYSRLLLGLVLLGSSSSGGLKPKNISLMSGFSH